MATKLETEVRRIIKSQSDGDIKGFMNDLRYGGCQSGLVGPLIYYHDTVKFYKRHKTDISVLLSETLAETGLSVSSLFSDKWDECDPLALDIYNQNLLAWFGFEETANRLYPDN